MHKVTRSIEGLGLPIYPPEAPVIVPRSSEQLRTALTQTQGATAIRALRTSISPDIATHEIPNLQAALEVVDNEHVVLTDTLGGSANVIDYEWGLWAPHQSNWQPHFLSYTLPDRLRVPANYLLVAEVAVIRDHQQIESGTVQWSSLTSGTAQYRERRSSPLILSDVFVQQFIQPNNTFLAKYVDIEPRLRKPYV